MKNWKKVKLGSLLSESKIISKTPNTNKRITVKLNVSGIEKRPNTRDKKGATRYYIRKAGQFIYGKQNLHKGAFGIIPKELDNFESSSDIPAFDVDNSCYPEWIFYFFKKNNFYLKLERIAKGVGSQRIYPKQIYDLEIYLPPKEEQRKVLKEIKNAETKNQKLLKEIQLQEDDIIRLRQSIIQEAIQGKLTKEWRNQHANLESALELLKSIKARKQQLVKEKKIKNAKAFIKVTIDEALFKIPRNWEWCKLGEIINLKSGQDLKPSEYSDVNEIGLPYITGASNMLNEKIIINRWTNAPRSIAFKGDLLIVCKGSGVGKMAWLEEDSAHIARQIMSIQTIKSPLNYVKILLDANVKNFKKKATGIIPGISRQTVLETIIPLPPFKEQDIIIQKVKALLLKCDIMEQEVITNRESSESLILSVLNELLGNEDNVLINKKSIKKVKESHPKREIKYNSKTINMKLVELLKINGKLHAEDLWRMSEYYDESNESDSIDEFYAELKNQIEYKKKIKEAKEKGYLELV